MIDKVLVSIFRASGILRAATKRYVACGDVDSAIARVLHLNQTGYLACMTYLQMARNEDDARANVRMYQRLLDLTSISGLGATINVSLSQLGFALDPVLSQELLHQLVMHAVRNEALVWLDTSPLVDSQSNLEAAIQLNRIPGFRGHIGLALQADLFRTKHDIDCALEEKLAVRLHQYARSVDKSPTIKGAPNTQIHYQRLTEALLSSGGHCSLVTRDIGLIRHAIEIAGAKRGSNGSFEFQFPDGVPIPQLLLAGPWRIRVLVPFGPDSGDYVFRRLLGA